MVRSANQNEDIPWTQYEPATPRRSRNSSLASIATFASLASISSSVGRRLSAFWRPNTRDALRRESVPVPTEKRYVHVPTHAAADHFKTTTTPQVRKASMCPPLGQQQFS
ncbi:hypothetical protein NKR19_g2223 [Coniochaeta hoffmannii]|uniref:Uncharacterized protein n=1 Tax=Coniochaeta hoffmannii TaxID=91930 RepID=A0AA38VN87_9PEZI|nr:hypothetical protein NKR19_g2223 [Coniochaeta hoffmannii]